MPIKILTPKPWLKSEMISDFNATSLAPPESPAEEPKRTVTIPAFPDQFCRSGGPLSPRRGWGRDEGSEWLIDKQSQAAECPQR
jgi:hypothetical protein